MSAMSVAVLELGPDPDPRFTSLVDKLRDLGICVRFVIGHSSLSVPAAKHGAHFLDLRVAMRGGVIEDFWERSDRVEINWDVLSEVDNRHAVQAVVARYYVPDEPSQMAGLRAFSAWLAYWHRAIADLSVDTVFFYASPHTVYAQALFFAARAARARCRILRHTSVDRMSYVAEDIYASLMNAIPVNGHMARQAVHERVSADIKRRQGGYASARPDYTMSQRNSNKAPEVDLALRAGTWLHRRATFRPHGGNATEATASYLTSAGGRLVFPDVLSVGTRWKHQRMRPRWLAIVASLGAKRRLLDAYKRAVQASPLSVNSSKPFFLFPWHFQPERTTAPEAGRWVSMPNTTLACCAAMPSDSDLLVREHIAQLHVRFHGQIARDATVYRSLQRIDSRIQFGRLEDDIFELVDRASGVITATGTVGWEALSRGGTRVLCSSGAWYSGLPGTFHLDQLKGRESFFNDESCGHPALSPTALSRAVAKLSDRIVEAPLHRNQDTLADDDTIDVEASRIAHAVAS